MIAEQALTYQGQPLDLSQRAFGELRASAEAIDDVAELRRRFDDDGYLYIPNLLDRERVWDARLEFVNALDQRGYIDRAYPLTEAVAKEELSVSAQFLSDVPRDNEPLREVLFDGPMMAFYEKLLGGAVRHFDFIWSRVKSSGQANATSPHCDIVFMGRGTKRLYTSWTPLGDVPKEMGGLMILENSHKQESITETYCQMDVDAYCTNYPDATEIESGQKNWQDPNGGSYSKDAIGLRADLQSRWLTTDYQLGDLLIFNVFTMHASLDNLTNRLRISTDTRYQLASEPVDERWIGEDPIAHGLAAKKGTIC